MSVDPNSRHWVYRCFDESGRLIYVGFTATPSGRIAAHESQSWWASQIARIEWSDYPTRADARAAEKEAIATENPRWNTLGRWAQNSAWNSQDFRDYMLAYRLGPSALTAYGRKHIRRVNAMYDARFPELEVISA